MNRRTSSILTAIFTIATAPAVAQWLNLPTEGIPRTKDGKPDLFAPAPRARDGKSDLSGVWNGGPKNIKYFGNLAADFKPGELPIQPWAQALTKQRMTRAGAGERPSTHCLPGGILMADAHPALPAKIVQKTDLVVILYEAYPFRQIFLDGRTVSNEANPTWMGYSVGHWDGDTLVVDTSGFNGKTWLDVMGHPSTEGLHLTERFRRRDFGHLDLQLTIDDPEAYAKPWSVTESWEISLGDELIEYVCNEGERDLKHLPRK
jgi:hypothetical protein